MEMGRVVGETGVGEADLGRVNRGSLQEAEARTRESGGRILQAESSPGTKVGMSLECRGAVRKASVAGSVSGRFHPSVLGMHAPALPLSSQTGSPPV